MSTCIGTNHLHPHAYVAPIHKVPVELITDILSIGLRGLKSNATASYLANISSICSAWRSITLSTPLLWTSIHFGLGESIAHIGVLRKALRTVQTFLTRSQDASLDVELVFVSGNFHNQASLDQLIPMLAPHTRRFRSITIDVNDEGSARRLFPLNGAYPRLRRINVRCDIKETRIGLVEDLPLVLFSDESECVASLDLQHLSLSGWKIILGMRKVANAALSNLDSIHIVGEVEEWVAIIHILQRCPRITAAHLSIAAHPVPEYSSVLMSKLTFLKITDQALPGFALFSAPALTNIVIIADKGRDLFPYISTLPSPGAAPHFPALRSVTLRRISMVVIRPFLMANPQVISLTLERCERYNDMHVVAMLMLLGAGDGLLTHWRPYRWKQHDAVDFERRDGVLPMLETLTVVASKPTGPVAKFQAENARKEWRAALQEELMRRRPLLRVDVLHEGE